MDTFWRICSEVTIASSQNKIQKANALIKKAEAAMRQGVSDEDVLEKRIGFIRKLWSHVADRGPGNDTTAACGGGLGANVSVNVPAIQPKQAPDVGAKAGTGNQPTWVQVNQLKETIQRLKKKNVQQTAQLSRQPSERPSIDPMCINDPTFTLPEQDKEDFGIILFGFTRVKEIGLILESLKRQDALKYTEVWLDGHQGNHNVKLKLDESIDLIKSHPVKSLHTQAGNFGFRKMLIMGLAEMCRKYRDILILEDDCFPTRDAVTEFRRELDLIRNDTGIFSVYGHPFLVESETETCNRFQGWGWATTSEKLLPVVRQLMDCYSMSEAEFLEFVKRTLTSEVKARIDVTHPRQPSFTLEKFFAWDETLCLLTALNNQVHKPTRKRTIFNCGMGEESTHFKNDEFRHPPFNLITPAEAWAHF